ncbi:MAG: hypothetical protein NZ901_01745 [Geminocystis sp.]|nr:hypothetical protein [Geminocystis sp.]HIK36803.1 hypothetical protein [Geminocystis sp. M7585_C2015_104]MCS7146892.1 hypothetical protein [Geminocystis sp.]MCX8078912.1 hypothetical protein [Geminocystis sp.]MDW8115717.1 hypothetical protein [Geminocystis sp.]
MSFDEVWTYVKARKGEKRKSVHIWNAVKFKDGREKTVFEVGDRNGKTFLEPYEKFSLVFMY